MLIRSSVISVVSQLRCAPHEDAHHCRLDGRSLHHRLDNRSRPRCCTEHPGPDLQYRPDLPEAVAGDVGHRSDRRARSRSAGSPLCRAAARQAAEKRKKSEQGRSRGNDGHRQSHRRSGPITSEILQRSSRGWTDTASTAPRRQTSAAGPTFWRTTWRVSRVADAPGQRELGVRGSKSSNRSEDNDAIGDASMNSVRQHQVLGLLHGRGVCLLGKRRDVAENSRVVLMQAEEMSAARTAVVPERVRTFTHKVEGSVLPARWTLLDLRHDLGQPSSFLESPGGIPESWSRLRELHDTPRVWRPASGKCRDVVDQFPGLLVHAPDVAARTTVVVSARGFAQRTAEAGPDHRRTLDT